MISVCVPIFNTEHYLERCIESLINQSYHDIEIVLVDDGSTDASGSICDEAQKRDNRIRVIHQENLGEAAARNSGLNAVQSEYVCFLDSDDEYATNAIKELKDAIEISNSDLSIGGYLEISSSNTHMAIAHAGKYNKESIARSVLFDKGSYGDAYIFSTVNAKLFKTSIIRDNNIQFNEMYLVGNDSLFFCDYLDQIGCATNTFSAIYRYYKYDFEERMQGMGWTYPDAFILEMIVRNHMYKFLNLPGIKKEDMLIVDYMGLINGLSELVGYENMLSFNLIDYIVYCRKEIPCYEIGALLECEYKMIKDKNKYGIPFDIVSELIKEGEDEGIVDLLKCINKIRGRKETAVNVRKILKM